MGCLPDNAIKAHDMSTRWYVLGKQRLETEFNIIKVIKSLRTLNMLGKPSRDTKAHMILDKKNLIEVDTDDIIQNAFGQQLKVFEHHHRINSKKNLFLDEESESQKERKP